MRVEKLHVANFRGISEFDIEFKPGLNVLVGDNGAGKTRILEALALALSPYVNHLSTETIPLSGLKFVPSDMSSPPATRDGLQLQSTHCRLEISVAMDGDSYPWSVEKNVLDQDFSRPLSVVGGSKLLELVGKVRQAVFPLNGGGGGYVPIVAYYSGNRAHSVNASKLTVGEAAASPMLALKDCMHANQHLSDVGAWLRDSTLREVLDNQRNMRVGKPFVASPGLDFVRSAITRFTQGGSFEFTGCDVDEQGVITFISSSGDSLKFNQLSQGYKSVVGLVIDIARRLDVACKNYHEYVKLARSFGVSNSGSESVMDDDVQFIATRSGVVLIDEIDLHLHPSWQQRILMDLTSTFPFLQFIVTTHSPQVLSTVKREDIQILDSDSSGRIVSGPPLAMTYGEPSGDVLHSVMMVDPQPPVKERADLQRLTEWVDQGDYESEDAIKLKLRLIAALGERHPQLMRLQRSIERQKALKQ